MKLRFAAVEQVVTMTTPSSRWAVGVLVSRHEPRLGGDELMLGTSSMAAELFGFGGRSARLAVALIERPPVGRVAVGPSADGAGAKKLPRSHRPDG